MSRPKSTNKEAKNLERKAQVEQELVKKQANKRKKQLKSEVNGFKKAAQQAELDKKSELERKALILNKKANKRRWVWFRLGFCLFLTAVIVELVLYLVSDVLPALPDIEKLADEDQRATTKIYDRNHHLLYSIYEDENRTPIRLEDVAPVMRQATVSIEDAQFYKHQGFSISGIMRAMRNNYFGERVEGGSTITQQLVKNRLLTRERTLDRKIKELILSVLVEGSFSKDKILEMYLNDVSYGGTVYGVEQAAVSYFGKNAKNLTLGEAAYLASLTTAPSFYSPYAGNMDAALVRRDEVFRRMIEEGYVTWDEVVAAKSEPLNFMPGAATIYAPHFVMYVRQYLTEMYGAEAVKSGGLEVTTSLDLALQNETQEILSKEMTDLKRLRISNGAVLITNPQTGEILTMLGSKDYWDFEHDGQVNVTLAQRQPGSSIKPLTYALAFANGESPATQIDDVPFNYVDPWSKKVYAPKNYDGRFHGRVTLRESLGSSYNIPAVKTLYEFGVNNLVDFAQKLGITTWNERKRFGLSLTLGAGEVKMTDMAVAYGTFANGGYKMDLNPILEVKNSRGEIIYNNSCAQEGINCPDDRVLPEEIAYQVTNVLSDNKARTPGFGPQSVLNIPDQEVAVKTGTTNNLRDNWTIGYTSDRLVAVWVGNNDNKSMSYVASGITGASPIWQKTMKLMLSADNKHQFKVPKGLVAVESCDKTGVPKCNSNCSSHLEYYAPKYQQVASCTPKNDQINGLQFQPVVAQKVATSSGVATAPVGGQVAQILNPVKRNGN